MLMKPFLIFLFVLSDITLAKSFDIPSTDSVRAEAIHWSILAIWSPLEDEEIK